MRKTERIEMRLTPEEKMRIKHNSIKANMSISEYLINCGTNYAHLARIDVVENQEVQQGNVVGI